MRALLAPAAIAALLAGCGAARRAPEAAAPPKRDPPPEVVVLDWADALRHDLDADAARYFAPNAKVMQGDESFVLPTPADAERFNASLPCQGRVVAMSRDGNVVTAVFVLDNRHTFACAAVGTADTVQFTIVHGKIAVWERLPD